MIYYKKNGGNKIIMKKLTAIVIGAGGRGMGYTKIMHDMEDKFELVGIAEPVPERVEFELSHFPNVPKENIYDTWEKILDRPKFADFALIATQDQMHIGPALKAIELGYDILLEKPIAPTAEECKKIAEAAKAKGVKVLVCHVLRYTPLYGTLKKLLDEGKIGRLMSVQALEPVGNRHMAHSFVRGKWGNSDTSCPMILAKCCHDTDIIQWLVGSPCKKVSSFGNLSYFTKENKPEGAPSRCTEDCPHRENCVFDVKKLYMDNEYMGGSWFRETATDSVNVTDEQMWASLQETNYGTCIYEANNNVVDHQIVNMEFENGATASLTMTAFSPDGAGRAIRLFGTEGMLEVTGSGSNNLYTKFGQRVKDQWGDKVSEEIDFRSNGNDVTSGHGGGDAGLLYALYEYFTGTYTGNAASTAEISYLNHLISFGAEESRVTDKVIDIKEYSKNL